MNFIFKSKRLKAVMATEYDISWIMNLEQSEDFEEYICQGSFKEHLNEIRSSETYLCRIEEYETGKRIGFFLAIHDFQNNSFELRRFAITKQQIGYGYEFMIRIMDYAFEELKVHKFWLDVFTNNKPAIKLYQKLNMTNDGLLRDAYKKGLNYKSYYIFSMLDYEYYDFIVNRT